MPLVQIFQNSSLNISLPINLASRTVFRFYSADNNGNQTPLTGFTSAVFTIYPLNQPIVEIPMQIQANGDVVMSLNPNFWAFGTSVNDCAIFLDNDYVPFVSGTVAFGIVMTPNQAFAIMNASRNAALINNVQYENPAYVDSATAQFTVTVDSITGVATVEVSTKGGVWYTGNGAPSNSLGANGDFYFDTLNFDLYGPKAAGVWPAPVSFVTDADLATALLTKQDLNTNLTQISNATFVNGDVIMKSGGVLTNEPADQLPVSVPVQDALSFKEDKANKGQPNGYAPLDSNSLVPTANLPSFQFPVTSVFGRTGDILAEPGDYDKTDVGLDQVDNTSDINKPVSTAQAAADAATLVSAEAYADTIGNLFIFKPSGVAAGNVYTDWVTLFIAFFGRRGKGQRIIEYHDDAAGTGFTIPAGTFTSLFENVIHRGVGNGGGFTSYPLLTFSNGATGTGTQFEFENLSIDNQNTTNPITVIDNNDNNQVGRIGLTNFKYTNSGTKPFISVIGTNGGQAIIRHEYNVQVQGFFSEASDSNGSFVIVYIETTAGDSRGSITIDPNSYRSAFPGSNDIRFVINGLDIDTSLISFTQSGYTGGNISKHFTKSYSGQAGNSFVVNATEDGLDFYTPSVSTVSSVFGRTGAVVAQSGDYTKSDVGLGNVDNTSDANKPISTATQTALNLKANAGANTDITSIVLNQTGLTVKGATSNALTIKPNETLSAARTLSLVTNDASRSLTIAGDSSVNGTFSGTSSGTNTGDQTNITGNAATATTLATGRTISVTGDMTYTSPSFDGSGNVTAAGTLATVNSNVGSFGSATQVSAITVNGKGLVTAASNVSLASATFVNSILPVLHEHGIFNTKFTAVNNTTTEQSLGIDLSTATFDINVAVRNASTNGDVTWLSTSSPIKITLSTGTVTGTVANITTTATVTLFLYAISDNGSLVIGLSRSNQHTSVPANYFHTNTASARTAVGTPSTAWDCMWISKSGAISGTNACVCLGQAGSVIFDGTNGRASATALVTGAIPKWNDNNTPIAGSLRYDSFVGFGSTNTKIARVMTNKTTDTMNGIITVADSATLGGTFTVNAAGRYSMSWGYTTNANSDMGISLNSNQLTTNIWQITAANRIASTAMLGDQFMVNFTGTLAAGDVLRMHTDGDASALDSDAFMIIEKLA